MPYCETCRGNHEAVWGNCRACTTGRNPTRGDMFFGVDLLGAREYYCCFCGRITVAAAALESGPAIHYPEGLAADQRTRHPRAAPGKLFKILALDQRLMEIYDPVTGLFLYHARMAPRPPHEFHARGWPRDELLMKLRSVFAPPPDD